MFARIAKVLTLERPHAVRVQGGQTFSKINAPPRRRRPVLVCRWHLDSVSGKPACAWEVESPDLLPEQLSSRIVEFCADALAQIGTRSSNGSRTLRREPVNLRGSISGLIASEVSRESRRKESIPGEAGEVADES